MHHHILWSSGKLDWDRFATRFDAEASAKKLVQIGETYTIEEYDDTACPACLSLITPKPADSIAKKKTA